MLDKIVRRVADDSTAAKSNHSYMKVQDQRFRTALITSHNISLVSFQKITTHHLLEVKNGVGESKRQVSSTASLFSSSTVRHGMNCCCVLYMKSAVPILLLVSVN